MQAPRKSSGIQAEKGSIVRAFITLQGCMLKKKFCRAECKSVDLLRYRPLSFVFIYPLFVI